MKLASPGCTFVIASSLALGLLGCGGEDAPASSVQDEPSARAKPSDSASGSAAGAGAREDEPAAAEDEAKPTGAEQATEKPAAQPAEDPAEPQAPAAVPADQLPERVLDSLELVAPEAGGRALFTDIVQLAPNEDATYCTYIDGVTEQPLYIHDTRGTQSPFGHHAILYYTTAVKPAGTVRCRGADMESMRQVLGGTGGDGALSGQSLPPNVVSEIPAGAQLVINHHWINTGSDPIEAQAELVTVPAQGDEELVIVRSLALVVPGINVAPGQSGEADGACAFQQDMDFLFLLGHEHEWGTHVRAELQRSGAEAEPILDHDYGPDLVAHPHVVTYPIDDPLHVQAGDTVSMHCEWRNDTDEALSWPTEMCVLFGWKVGGQRDAICYNGSWVAQ